MFIENLDPTDGKPVPHPTLDEPVVEDLVSDKQRQRPLRRPNRMLNLKPVSISPRLQSRVSVASLKLIPLTQPEFAGIKTQRDRQRESILPNFAPGKWLHANALVVWRDAEILSPTKSKSNAHAFINRVADITPQSQCTQKIEINILRDGHRKLDVSPLLIVTLNSLRGREATQCTKEKGNVEDVSQVAPFDGRTVNEVSATTTRSPTCNRVALASGLGRVAIIDLVDCLSGGCVVK